jgi:hypothetical protein
MVDRRVFIWHEKASSWLKAKERGEMTMEQGEYGAFHYWNYVRRLKAMREVFPQGTRVVFLGAGEGNHFPTFRGIDQTISDFFGTNAIHLPMESSLEDIMSFKPSIIVVVNTRYRPEWYEIIKQVHRQGVTTALYWMDLRRPRRGDLYWNNISHSLIDYFDHIFFCVKDDEWINEWQSATGVPTTYLPQATIQHPVPPRGEKYHVVHIGDIMNSQFHTERHRHVNEIQKSVAVENINSPKRPDRIEISKRSYGIYGSSDWCISLSERISGYSSDRMYHILGAGGRLARLNSGGHDHLKEYGYFFESIEEMIEALKTTPEDGIKEKAFKYAQSHELYKDRYIQLFKTLCA